MRNYGIVWFIFIGLAECLLAQEDYNAYYRAMNPAQDSLSSEKNLVVLQVFTDSALLEKDTVRAIHGHLYQANILVRSGDYYTTIDHLLAAERLAVLQNNTLLLGRIYHKKATVYAYLEDLNRAIEYFDTARKYHLQVRDSQYLGITYEQLGAMYGARDSFTIANRYYELAIPVIKKHNSEKSLAVTFANYGNVLSYQDSTKAAMHYYQEAIALNAKLGSEYQMVPCLQNLAGEYVKLERYEEALPLYYEALNLNRKNDWLGFMIYTYSGLASIHEAKEQLDSAIYYHHLYQELSDSVAGPGIQTDILQLETDLILEEKETLLSAQKFRTLSVVLVSLITLLISGSVVLILYRRNKEKSKALATNRERLAALTKRLQTKNTSLRDVQQMTDQIDVTVEKTRNPSVFDPYDTLILKTEDWDNFKLLFEKSYPGYLYRLRTVYPELTEAEERLFLLLKLNLTTREVANTLGIQQESVKKTRTRLRKRLQLQSSNSLSEFINNF